MLNFKNFKCRKKVNNIGRRPIKENFYLILLKNEPPIGRRPIKGDSIFLI